MRRRVAREPQVLRVPADDLVDDGGRNAVRAEAADGEVVAVVDESPDGVLDGSELIDEGARLRPERQAGLNRGGVGYKGTLAPREGVRHRHGHRGDEPEALATDGRAGSVSDGYFTSSVANPSGSSEKPTLEAAMIDRALGLILPLMHHLVQQRVQRFRQSVFHDV